MSSQVSIACFGEILWDCLPRGLFLGGAPLNVAYHLNRVGVKPLLISAVGRDFLGDEACRRLRAWGVDSSMVARNRQNTGTVRASLTQAGAASYRFDAQSAWDAIPASKAVLSRAEPPAAIVFGTLALRKPANRRTLDRIFGAWPAALRVLDVNLRPPFDRMSTISWALARATILKLNAEELAALVGPGGQNPDGWGKAARQLARTRGIHRICLTAGAGGAGLLWDGIWHWVHSRVIRVRDTIGAGDAFLAALLAELLVRAEYPVDALVRAVRLGEFVAKHDGATPSYTIDAKGLPVGSH